MMEFLFIEYFEHVDTMKLARNMVNIGIIIICFRVILRQVCII